LTRPITFRVLGLTESGRLEVLQQGFMRRYVDVEFLAKCLQHDVTKEIPDAPALG